MATWIIYALLAAASAALVGITGIDSTLASFSNVESLTTFTEKKNRVPEEAAKKGDNVTTSAEWQRLI
jgi:hypothetical protein